MPSPTVKEFDRMMEALDFIDWLKQKRKLKGVLNTKFTVTYTEPPKTRGKSVSEK